MGNKHNQRYNGNNHRHVFKRKNASKYKKPIQPTLSTLPKGSRIINLEKLQQYTADLAAHSSRCNGSMVLIGETRHGLASILRGHCPSCSHRITLETSPKVRGPRGCLQWECNLAAVWGEMTTGGGHSRLEESMSVLGVPVMTKKSFIRSERGIGEVWKQSLIDSMLEAGREEKRLAEERNDYHEGVPAITVVVDGGWSKRSHKHSYNAKSGVAIIIGRETGKLLHIGVRNKFCAACARNIPREKHACYRNWNASSSEMETDILLEGFMEAERVHGVRYLRFVGDGDSAVHTTLLQGVPGWGHAIRKLECANHMCKCYRGALERLVQENPSYKGSGGLTSKMRKRLVSAARSAIRMRSREADPKKAAKLLGRDLINGPNHCFGVHDGCSPDFCSAVSATVSASDIPGSQDTNDKVVMSEAGDLGADEPMAGEGEVSESEMDVPIETAELGEAGEFGEAESESGDQIEQCEADGLRELGGTASVGDEREMTEVDESENCNQSDEILGVISLQEQLWMETTADDPAVERDARRGGTKPDKVNPKLLYDIQRALTRMVSKANQLVSNVTTNIAESWMHIRSKFDGGKVIFRSQSNSWGDRCMGAGLQQNVGKQWGPVMWKQMTNSDPNPVFTDAAERSAKQLQADNQRKATEGAKAKRRRSKYATIDNGVAARRAYSRHDGGVLPDEADDDVSQDTMEQLKQGFYDTKVVVTSEEAKTIERQTIDQADNEQWINERHKRITASKVGGIAKMRANTKRSKKVQQLLYATFKGNAATRYGTEKENSTRQHYVTYMRQNGHPHLNVELCGLFVSLENPWLAGTPDGLVHDPNEHPSSGLVEIKNPYSVKDLTLSEAIKKPAFCLEKKGDNTFRLKQRHDYFYQVQCQLYCSQREWCDFVVRTDMDMHVERIHRDSSWWSSNMEKLKTFYFSSLLPELACPRHHKGGIREPGQLAS